MIIRPKNWNLNVKKERKKPNSNLQSSNLKSSILPTELSNQTYYENRHKKIVHSNLCKNCDEKSI